MRRFKLRLLSFVVGALAILGMLAAAAPIHAAGVQFQWRRGYSVQHGWLCYGTPHWLHCTHHWTQRGGKFISFNPRWVPSQSTRVVRRAAPPAPKPPVVVGDGSAPSGSVRADIVAAFGPYAAQATRVAMCESSLNPNAKSPISTASGVFQFLRSTWAETPYHAYSPFNAYFNVQAAAWLFHRDGNSWREWSCGYRA